MVNNAGVFAGLHTIVDKTEEQYDFTMAVNVKSVWLGCRFAIAQMLRQEDTGGEISRGKITNIEGRGGEPHLPARGRLRTGADQRQRDLPGFPRYCHGASFPR